jgi:hypothetical protein
MHGVAQRFLDDFVAAASPDLDAALRRLIEELAPPPPQWLGHDEASLRRWVGSALVAAGLAVDATPNDPAQAIRFAIATARSLYNDPAFTA